MAIFVRVSAIKNSNATVTDKAHSCSVPNGAENEALRVSEVRYRRLFETAQDGILILDGVTGEITDANPFVLQMLGYALDDLLGKKLWEIGPFRDVKDSQRAFSVLQHDDYIRYDNLPLQSKEGRQVAVEFVSNAYLVDARRVIQCNIRDISKRKAAERAVRASNTQLQLLLAQVSTLIYSIDIHNKDGAIRYMSENVRQLLGYEAAEAYDPQWWTDNLHPEDLQRALAEREMLLKEGHATSDYRFRRKDGDYSWIRDDRRISRDAFGRPVEITGTWTDISERKNMEDQLRQATKMEAIGRLAGGIAHDFNNLLSVIIGYAQMMRQPDSPPSDTREHSEQIYLAAQRAASLTRQLLSFSRKQLLHLRTSDLNLVVTGISKMLTRLIGEDVSLKVECSAELLLVNADENLLEQVLTNLAVNARDAMPNGGKLSISTGRINIDRASDQGQLNAQGGDFVWMRVRDNGCGMTPETRARIFEPFFTTKDVGKGTGLGLPTVYAIVRQHQGWIEVESGIGLGTSFTIFLPAAVPSHASPPPVATAGKFLPSGSETILLVEDEPALQTMAARVLRNLGYRVHVAGDGNAAMVKWTEHREKIDLVLTDLVMPGGMSGVALAEALRTQDPNLCIVLTSGYTSLQSENVVLDDGEKFLPKPYTLEALAEIVRSSLDKRERRVGLRAQTVLGPAQT